MVRMANSRFSAFWLPSELPSPATRSCRVLNVRFLNWWLSSTKMWSMPICLKSATSSVLDFIACSTLSSFACRLNLRFSSPLSMARDTSFPCERSTSRFSSTVSSSACNIRCCSSGDCGIFPNWSWLMMTQSQSLFRMSLKKRTRFAASKSFSDAYSTRAFGYALR